MYCRLLCLFATLFLQRSLASQTYLCDRQASIANGSLPMEEGLRGAHLQISSGMWEPAFLRWHGDKLQGLEVDLLDELSRRAGFTYNLTLVNVSAIDSWTAYLKEAVTTADMVTFAYWTISPERMSLGAYSPYGFLDASHMMVTMPPEDENSTLNGIFSFLAPFSPGVWLCFISLTVLTGLVFQFLEASKNSVDYPNGPLPLSNSTISIFKSAGHVTGASGFAPKTLAGKVLVTSWTWSVVLILSAYTANLASFLVAKAEQQAGFGDIRGAVALQKTFVLTKGAPDWEWFKDRYPNYPNVIEVPNQEGKTTLLSKGKADIAILPRFEYHRAKQTAEINGRCTMRTVGEPLDSFQAGWMVGIDDTTLCKGVVRDVLALWFLRLELDGVLGSMINKALTPTELCPEPIGIPPDTNQLNLWNMLGIMCVHLVGFLVAALLYVMDIVAHRRTIILKEATHFSV